MLSLHRRAVILNSLRHAAILSLPKNLNPKTSDVSTSLNMTKTCHSEPAEESPLR